MPFFPIVAPSSCRSIMANGKWQMANLNQSRVVTLYWNMAFLLLSKNAVFQ